MGLPRPPFKPLTKVVAVLVADAHRVVGIAAACLCARAAALLMCRLPRSRLGDGGLGLGLPMGRRRALGGGCSCCWLRAASAGARYVDTRRGAARDPLGVLHRQVERHTNHRAEQVCSSFRQYWP